MRLGSLRVSRKVPVDTAVARCKPLVRRRHVGSVGKRLQSESRQPYRGVDVAPKVSGHHQQAGEPAEASTAAPAAQPPSGGGHAPESTGAAAAHQQQVAQPTGGVTLPDGRELEGFALLLLVAVLWGSYGPALRLLYNLPGPPTPVAVTAVSGCIEMVVLLSAWLLRPSPGTAADAGIKAAEKQQQQQQQQQDTGLPPNVPWRWLGLSAAVLAGLEIGLYNTAASYTQIAGLALTTATRAAFLIQASILFTPVLSTLAGMAPSRPVWLGSLLALAGTLLITQDSTGAAVSEGAAAAGFGGTGLAAGDALTLLAALCYSVATVRLPVWAVRYRVPALQLALGKAAVLTLVAAAAAGVQAVQLVAAGQPVATLWPGWQGWQGWAILVYAALAPGAVASVLHVKGQSLVPPATAQILFCSIPVFSAAMAAVLLPGEQVGLWTWAGGAVVAAAGLVAALGKPSRS